MNPHYELSHLGSSLQQARADWPGRQIGRISRWRHRCTAIRELQALSDHHLTNIGLDRTQIVSTDEEIIETGGQPA